MAHSMAWSFHKTTGIPFEDLLSSAFMAFAHGVKTYDSSKGSFSTYYFRVCQTRLIDNCADVKYWRDRKSRQPHAASKEEITDPLENPMEVSLEDTKGERVLVDTQNPERIVGFREAIRGMSKEARMVCRIIFEAPQEFLVHAPKLSRGKVKEELRKQGWSWSQIWNSFREIKATLTQIE